MATEIVQAPPRAHRQGQTAPLNPAAEAALQRLLAAFDPTATKPTVINGAEVSLAVAKAVTRWEIASARHAELTAAMDSRNLTPAEFDALVDSGRTIATSVAFLRDSGNLNLIRDADPATVEKVRTALGYRRGWHPDRYLGETATHLTVWSQMELNDLYVQLGGTVALRQAERSNRDGEPGWTATEISLTIDVAGVGPVTVVTDIEDDPEHGYRTDIPVVMVARYRSAETRGNQLLALARAGRMDDRDADDLAHTVELMAGHRATLAAAGRLDLIGGA